MIKQTLPSSMLLLVIFFAQVGLAQDKTPWTDLSLEERQILQQLEPQWENLSVERQQRLRRGANRFQQMQPQQREQAKNQQQRFQSLSQQQQQVINQRFQRFNSLSRPQQRRLRNVQRRFQNMPQVERERLREQFEQQRQRNPRPEQNNGARSSTPEQRIRQVIRQNRNVLRPNRAQSPQRPNDTRPPNR